MEPEHNQRGNSQNAWLVRRVGDFAKVKGGKRLPAGSALTSLRTRHPYIRIVDFKNGRIDASNLLFVPEEVFPRIARYTISVNDVWISIVGTVGLVGLVDASLDGANLTENAAKICDISHEVDKCFLSMFLRSSLGQEQIRAQTVGSTQPKLALFRIEDIQVPLPPLPEQRAIAHILGTLDDKIELNRRMNETLEAMARALFHDWFVAFGPTRAKMAGQEPYLPKHLWDLFPVSMDREMPLGWSLRPLSKFAALSTESVAPNDQPDALFEHFSIPAFDSGRMPAFDPGYTIKSNKYVVHPSSVLVSKLNPDTPRIWMPAIQTERPVCSTEFMQFIPHEVQNRPYLYLLMESQSMRESVLSHVTGSTGSRQRAQPKQIAVLDVLAPETRVMAAFNRQAGSLLERASKCQLESSTLTSLRDTLLPKLISGELRIPDAERILERAL